MIKNHILTIFISVLGLVYLVDTAAATEQESMQANQPVWADADPEDDC